MLKNFIKITYRNFFKHKTYSFINVLGLSIGIASCIIIGLFIKNELSYDNFHKNGNLFRVLRTPNDGQITRTVALTSPPFGRALLNDYPGVIKDAVMVIPNEGLVNYKDKSFREDKFYFADSNFFEIFSFPLVVGDPSSILADPNNVVISESIAKKYFGKENPIDKTIKVDNKYFFTIRGVFKDIPGNSHLVFDFMASSIILKKIFADSDNWWNNMGYTYIVLSTPKAKHSLESAFPAFMDKYFGDHFKETNMPIGLKLEALTDIYFNNETQFDNVKHGSFNTVYIFSGIALFILVIACINFMNLATARYAGRAKEVGLRKVIGAKRKDLIFQFLGEAVCLTFVAVILALLIVEITLPYFNLLAELKLDLNYNLTFLPVTLLLIIIVIGIMSGSYPALFLSSLKPVTVLKGKLGSKGGNIRLRMFLVIFQFVLSILLITTTILMKEQMNFLSAKNLGFDKSQVLTFPLYTNELRNQKIILRDELTRIPGVAAASLMSGEPGGYHDNLAYKAEGENSFIRMRNVFTDYNYLKTLGLKLKTGRDFSKEFSTDSMSVILNESAVKSFGWNNEEAPGKRIIINLIDSSYRTVIGVVEDFHFTSLKEKIEPLVIAIFPNHSRMSVKISSGDIHETVKNIEDTYRRFAPEYPFEFSFLDESFDNLYRTEKKQEDLFSVFSLLAIVISCLGLFGLIAFSSEQRTKEIGLRKVLGASVSAIIFLLLKDYLKLVIIANIIAWPLAFYVIQNWLQDFAYRINVTAFPFILSGVIALLIAFLTVAYQAFKAATVNPVKSLKYE